MGTRTAFYKKFNFKLRFRSGNSSNLPLFSKRNIDKNRSTHSAVHPRLAVFGKPMPLAQHPDEGKGTRIASPPRGRLFEQKKSHQEDDSFVPPRGLEPLFEP